MMPRLQRQCDVAVGAFVVQVCIKVISCWLLGEMAWANLTGRGFDWWMVAETEVSLKLTVPTQSPDSGWISQHPIKTEGSDMKNLSGHIGETPDLLETISILTMLQYQTQANQMRDIWYRPPLNTALVQSDDGGIAKDAIVGIPRRDADNRVVPVIMVKKGINEKLSDNWILTFARFEILSSLIIWSNLVVRSDSTSDKNRTKSNNYQYINYLCEQNASLIVIMIGWETIRWWDYSHW